MKLFAIVLTLLIPTISGLAQTVATSQEQEQVRRRDADLERRAANLRDLKPSFPGPRSGLAPRNLYEWRKDLEKLRKVDAEEIEAHEAFIKQKNTGIVKLFPDLGCSRGAVINVAGPCEGIVPESSAFSFRRKDYALGLYDVKLVGDQLKVGGFFSQGVIVEIGDLPIESLSLSASGLQYISELPADTDLQAASRTFDRLSVGEIVDSFYYTNSIKVRENTTYGLRVIAYRPRGDIFTSPAFRWLEYADDRSDVIAAIRVLKRASDGTVTFLWKVLDKKKSPGLKFEKGTRLVDFKKR